jgi:hypothetical protein
MFLRSLIQASAVLPFLYQTASAQTACNNSPQLCDRPYNNVTYLGAHNSPFLRNPSTSFSTSGNHFYDTTEQLDSGVRLLSGQVHKKNDTVGDEAWHLCHSSCDLLDAGTLSSWLTEVKTWMDKNPTDVVTILLVNADDATPAELGAQFQASGIDEMAYTPETPGVIPQSWPTLQSLISDNQRLVTFVASLSEPSADHPYLMDEFTFIFENNFENESPTDYSCEPNRPGSLSTAQAAESGRMFLMNHFLYQTQLFGIQSPNESYAETTNARTGLGSLGEQVSACSGVYGKAPNFVLCDFTNTGPAIASVDAANGVGNSTTGRRTLPSGILDEDDFSAGMKTKGNLFAVFVAVAAAVSFSM